MKRILLIPVSLLMLAFSFHSGNPLLAAGPRSKPPLIALSKGWTRTWGGDSAEAARNVTLDQAGNLYVIGEFDGTADFDPGAASSLVTSHGDKDIFLSKFDANGIFQWVKTWGGSGRDLSHGLGVDSLGDVYVVGSFQDSFDFNPSPTMTETHSSNAGSMNNIFLSKFDASGAFHWARTWGPSDGGAEAYSLAVDGSNHIYVQGDFSGTNTNFNPWDLLHPDWHTNHPGPLASFDAFLSKFDSNGNYVWAKTWGGEGYDDGPGVAVDGAGNIYVGGMYASKNINFDPAGGSAGANHPAHDSGFLVDAFLSKFDSDGNFKWVRTWGEQGTDDVGAVVTVDRANNVYLTGRFASVNCNFNPDGTADMHSSNGSFDAFLNKYDSNGMFQWAKTWGDDGEEMGVSLAVDAWNNIYASGVFSGTVNFAQGSGSDFRAAHGDQDAFLTAFAPNGDFQWAKTWGGDGKDSGQHIAIAGADKIYVVGLFSETVDFDPSGGGDNHNSIGGNDAFLSQFIRLPFTNTLYLPVMRK